VKKPKALAAVAALAQNSRLDIFRLLVVAGASGVAAGKLSQRTRVAPNTLTFHLDQLRDAGLVTVRREGRSMIYVAQYNAMNGLLAFLTENCCQGNLEACTPVQIFNPSSSKGACRPNSSSTPNKVPRSKKKKSPV
jgi:ArsR family transcriptional regulator